MGPRVVRRLSKKSTAKYGRGAASKFRGPKSRPMFRLWEYATWRVRMRAWCNQMKATLLGSEHDPDHPQTYRVIQSAECPIDSASTWLTWWEGTAIPRPTQVTAAERLTPGSSSLLELEELRTPLSRHLYALDVLTTKFRTEGTTREYRETHTARLLDGLNDAWGSFLDTSPPSRNSQFNVQNQIGLSAESLIGEFELWPEQQRLVKRLGGNPIRWALPQDVVMQHNWLEPLSIFRFLSLLAGCEGITHPKLIELWALDLASAEMAVRALTETPSLRRPRWPIIRMVMTGGMHLMASYTFSSPPETLLSELARNTAYNTYGPAAAELALTNLQSVRSSYFAVFASLGIAESAIRRINAIHLDKTWDDQFSIPRKRL
jgi:hypothetical protein